MAEEFRFPDVGEGIHEGELVEWLVKVGDKIKADQPVAMVETDKAVVEIPAPSAGTILKINHQVGDTIKVGEVLLVVGKEGEKVPDTPSPTTPAPTQPSAPPPAAPASATAPATAPSTAAPGKIRAAPATRKLAKEQGVDLAAVQGSGPGGRITDADVKAASARGARADSGGARADSGGARADSGGARADSGGARADSGGARSGSTVSSPAPAAAQPASAVLHAALHDKPQKNIVAAPSTRKLAREKKIDIARVRGTGAGGRITDSDVLMASGELAAPTPPALTQAAPPAFAGGARFAPEPIKEEGPAAREKLKGVRKKIAERMARSMYTAPHVTHMDEVDVTQLVAVRKEEKEKAKKKKIHLTFLPFIMKAVVLGLEKYPSLSASLDETTNEIVYKKYYHIGIATDTPSGLMVPVIRDVDKKSILTLAKEVSEKAQAARDRKIALKDLKGGCFTITNVGSYGGVFSTPIINFPEVAILGVHRIHDRPRVVDGKVQARKVLTLTVTFDHRVVDGASAAQFLNEVMLHLEDPNQMLMELV